MARSWIPNPDVMRVRVPRSPPMYLNFDLPNLVMAILLEYVILKFGKDYIRLYEKNNGKLAESGIAPDLKSETLGEPGDVGSNPTLAAKIM